MLSLSVLLTWMSVVLTYRPFFPFFFSLLCFVVRIECPFELLGIGLDWTGLDWTGLDWTGLDWTDRLCVSRSAPLPPPSLHGSDSFTSALSSRASVLLASATSTSASASTT